MESENPYRPPSARITHPAAPGTEASSRARSAGGKVYHLDCSCGRRINVTAADAGTNVVCDCGNPVRVPSLSKLREFTGADPYESGTIDTIRRLLARGELLADECCVISGRPISDVLRCSVVVSSVMVHRERLGMKLLLGVVVSPLFFWIPSLHVRISPAPGTETEVPTPVRLCSKYHARFRRAGQWRLRRLLRRVPIYAKLLDEYPLPTVKVGI